MSRPQTEEEWLLVLDVIERLQNEVRAGNWDALRKMLHGHTKPASPAEPSAGQPPEYYRLQRKDDPSNYYHFSAYEFDLILVPRQPLTKGDKP